MHIELYSPIYSLKMAKTHRLATNIIFDKKVIFANTKIYIFSSTIDTTVPMSYVKIMFHSTINLLKVHTN